MHDSGWRLLPGLTSLALRSGRLHLVGEEGEEKGGPQFSLLQSMVENLKACLDLTLRSAFFRRLMRVSLFFFLVVHGESVSAVCSVCARLSVFYLKSKNF